jgi:hypothetical protein
MVNGKTNSSQNTSGLKHSSQSQSSDGSEDSDYSKSNTLDSKIEGSVVPKFDTNVRILVLFFAGFVRTINIGSRLLGNSRRRR